MQPRSPRRKPGDSGSEPHTAYDADPGPPNGPVSPDSRPGLFVQRASGPEETGQRERAEAHQAETARMAVLGVNTRPV